jgi:hypothetical protein
MVGPHTKNGYFKKSKKNIRMETNGKPTTGKTEIEMVGRCVYDDPKVLKVRNWKELGMERRAWSVLSETAKTHKGL